MGTDRGWGLAREGEEESDMEGKTGCRGQEKKFRDRKVSSSRRRKRKKKQLIRSVGKRAR